jgi:hypothetical protein
MNNLSSLISIALLLFAGPKGSEWCELIQAGKGDEAALDRCRRAAFRVTATARRLRDDHGEGVYVAYLLYAVAIPRRFRD